MKVVRWVVILLLAVTVLLCLSPGIAYVVALARVDGRPEPADPSSYSQEVIEAAWLQCHETLPMSVQTINPWGYVFGFYDYDLNNRPSGERAAGRIAMVHNSAHPAVRHNMLWWHSSGAALSIWITRNWSAQQIGATLVRDNLCERRVRVRK